MFFQLRRWKIRAIVGKNFSGELSLALDISRKELQMCVTAMKKLVIETLKQKHFELFSIVRLAVMTPRTSEITDER